MLAVGFERKKAGWAQGLLLFALVIYVPLEPIVGYHKLKKLCEMDGGLVIHDRVSTNSIYFPRAYSTDALERLQSMGFETVEFDTKTGGYARYSIGSKEPQMVSTLDSTVSSTFTVMRPVSTGFGNTMSLLYRSVENINTGNKIAEFRAYAFYGTWWDDITYSGMNGGQVTCVDLFPDEKRYGSEKNTLLLGAVEMASG